MQAASRADSGLARIDFGDFSDLEQLREQALAKLPVSGEKPVLRERYEATDASGMVGVVLDTKGMVVDVDVSRDWRHAVSPEEFAAALMQAYTVAVVAAVEDVALGDLWEEEQRLAAERRREQEERWAAQRGETLPPPPSQPATRMDVPPEDPRDWMNWLNDSLYSIGDELHRIEQLERAAAEVQDKVAWGQRGYLKVIHRGTDIISITGDPARIRMAEPYQLRSEALEVLRSAQHDTE